MKTVSEQPVNDTQGYDPGEPRTGLIGVFMAAVVVGLALTILGVQAYFDHVKQQQIFVKVLAPVSEDLLDLHAREDSELHSYRYLDRTKGTVRVPIERAMELLAGEYAEGRLPYPTKPTPVKKPAPAGGANLAAK